jgi:hypothetical protein
VTGLAGPAAGVVGEGDAPTGVEEPVAGPVPVEVFGFSDNPPRNESSNFFLDSSIVGAVVDTTFTMPPAVVGVPSGLGILTALAFSSRFFLLYSL